MRKKTPTVTGAARSSITVQIDSEAGGRVYAKEGGTVHYVRILEQGSGLYGPYKQPIRPTKAKVLAWHPRTATGKPIKSKGGGAYTGMIVRRSVKGQKPKGMFHNTFAQDKTKILDKYRDAFRKSFGVN